MATDAQALHEIWLKKADSSLKDELANMSASEVDEAFFAHLKFGTGGIRGLLGAGTNRMNIHTVARATQGLAQYLCSNCDSPSVVIARDSRNCGELFTKTAAAVLAANDVHVFLFPRIEPTPALSFAVRDLHCSAGICITASHNPAAYNGYKVYNSSGCQITVQAAELIQDSINSVDMFDGVSSIPFERGIELGLIEWVDEGVLQRFTDAALAQSKYKSSQRIKLAYTPLHGAGLECALRVLEGIDSIDVTVESEQARPDGNFPSCPYPNPESEEALKRGLSLCAEIDADLLVATDPDADRIGVAVRDGSAYRLLSGNELGMLLAYYMLFMRKRDAGDLSNCVVITTVVSTTMVDALAEQWGFELRRTLTGFKYIGEQIDLIEQESGNKEFLFGFEESYGYLVSTHVRDKDAISALVVVCEMVQWCADQGMTVTGLLDSLYQQLGYYRSGLVTVEFPGSAGVAKMSETMSMLRSGQEKAIAGLQVKDTIDYRFGVDMPVVGGDGRIRKLPQTDMLEFLLERGCKVCIRPSGTEPKLKAYIHVKGSNRDEADGLYDTIAESIAGLIN